MFISIKWDQKIYDKINGFKERNTWVKKISPFASHIQELGIGSTCCYLFISSFHNKEAKNNLILLVGALGLSQIICVLGKIFFSRERPYEKTAPGGRWYGPITGMKKRFGQKETYCKCLFLTGIKEIGKIDRYSSFPSGHTVAVFTTATIISERYKNNKAVPVISYSLATICGLSRITQEMHWLSDVIAGAIIGYICAKYIIYRCG